MQKKIRQVIANNLLFEGLRPDLIDEIATSATWRSVSVGEILFQKGDPANALWGVLSGRIVLEVGTVDGKEMVLDTIVEGGVFGEVGVLDFGPRLGEARATRKSELFRLERKHFLRYLQKSPELCFRVFSMLCAHLRDTTENLEDTTFYKLSERLAKRLIMLSDAPSAGEGGVVHIGQSELACLLGVNREAVNRHLRMFEKDGLIALSRQKIEIIDQPALANLSSPGQINHHGGWGHENLAMLDHQIPPFSHIQKATSQALGRHLSGLLAIDAVEYSSSLKTDAAGTLQRIEVGLRAIERAIEQFQGHIVWHTGDRVLAEFPDAQLALHAALAIQQRVNSGNNAGKRKKKSLFRIGVHYGEVLAEDKHFLGKPVDTVIRLSHFAGAGGIAISGSVRDALENLEQLDWRFLGDHELKNVSGTVPVYSARPLSIFKMLALRSETLVSRRLRPAVVSVAVIFLLAGFWFTADHMGEKNSQPVVAQLSIAVLPFTSSGDQALDYLAAGIPDDVRVALSRIHGMRVIGRESSDYFKEHTASTVEIGRALNVAWLLRGSFTDADGEIHASVQLLSTLNNEVVWERSFKASVGDPVALGSDIVRRTALSLGVSDTDSADLPQLLPLTNNAEAQANYLEAQRHMWRGRQRHIINAVPLLQAAVKLDPSFAEAHALLAELYLTQTLLDEQVMYIPGLRQKLARESLQKALSLKPDSPLVLSVMSAARLFDDDYEGATVLAERALRIDPNNTAALLIRYRVQVQLQDWFGALLSSERMMKLEPMSVKAMMLYRNQLFRADRYQESLVVANRALALYPENEMPVAHQWAAVAKLKMGDRLGAIDSSRLAMPYGPPYGLWTGLEYDWGFRDDIARVRPVVGLVYVGDYEQTREILISVCNDNNTGYSKFTIQTYWNTRDCLINRGELEALAGNFERSIEFFERAQLLPPIEDGGLVRTRVVFPVLEMSRQSHFSLALLYAYRKAGQHEKADAIARQFEDMMAEKIESAATVSESANLKFLYMQAQYYAIEGRSKEATDTLRAWLDYDVDIFTYVKWDPYLQSLCGNSEFEAIVAEVEAELTEIRAKYYGRQATPANV